MSEYRQPPLPPQFSAEDSYIGRGFNENEYQRRQDEDQLRLLGIFHYVMGAMAGLTALFPLIYVGMGIMVLAMPTGHQSSSDLPPAFMGYMFITFGLLATVVFAVISAFTIKAGSDLNARRGLTLIQVMACINCLHMPIGTVLGVFTLIVVNRPSVRALFERRLGSLPVDGLAEVRNASFYDR